MAGARRAHGRRGRAERRPQVPASRPAPAAARLPAGRAAGGGEQRARLESGSDGSWAHPPRAASLVWPQSGRPWPLAPCPGRLLSPRVSSAGAKRAPRASQLPLPLPGRLPRTRGWENPRAGDRDLAGCRLLHRGWAPTVLRAEGSPPPHADPRQGSPNRGAPSPRPPLSGVAGTATAFQSHLPGAPPPLGLSPARHRVSALSCRAARGAEVVVLPGRRAPTLQQVEPLSGLQQRLHPVSRPTAARGGPQR